MKQAARWLAIFEGSDEESPIDRLQCEFTAQPSVAVDYAQKIERALDPAIKLVAGPIPLNIEALSP